MTALLLALEGLIVATLAADLGRDFDLLTDAARIALLAAALAGAAPLLARGPRRRIAAGARLPLAALAGAGILLAGVALAAGAVAERLAAAWPAGARARLEERAGILHDDFTAFLDRLALPIREPEAAAPEAGGLFERLEEAHRRSRLPAERHGLAAHAADGTLLAWVGNSTTPPRSLLQDGDPGLGFAVGGRPGSPRLFAVRTGGPGDIRWVSEFVLRLPGPPDPEGEAAGVPLDFLPRWRRVAPAHVHLRRAPDGGDDLGVFFARQGDRHWSRVGPEAAETLSFPLRSRAGAVLAIASLADGSPAQAIAGRTRALRRAGAVGLALLLLAAWIPPARRGGARRRLLAGLAAIATARAALLLAGDAGPPSLPIFDITLYASPAAGGLLRSPFDLFLTAVAVLAAAFLVRDALRREPAPSDPGRRRLHRRWTAAALAAIGAGGAAVLHAFLDRVVLDARLDLGRVGGGLAAPRLLLQAALFALVAAWGLTLAALAGRLLRLLPAGARARLEDLRRRLGPPPLPAALRVALGTLLLTLLYVPVLHHAYDRLRRLFFEDDLLPRVLTQEERRRLILQDALLLAGEPEFAAGVRFAQEADGAGSDEAAYRLWAATPIAQRGLASSLQIFDPGGAQLARFALNFAPMLDVPFARAAAAADGGLVELPPPARATVRKPVLFGSRWVRAARRPPALLVLAVTDSWDNLPMVGSGNVTFELFRAPSPSRTNPELLRSDPIVAVFAADLERLYESGGEIPPPSPPVLERLRRGERAWVGAAIGDGPGRILYARRGDVVFALAHPHPGAAALVASFLRLLLLNAALAAVAAAVVAAGRRLAAGAPLRLPPATYAGRLVAVLLVSGLVPLLALAYFLSRFSHAESARDLLSAGLGSLQTARRVVEDYLDVSATDPEPALGDDVVFWLSRVIRQDISIYRGADLLATSTRELYGSGLLETRLPGGVYRALYLDREAFVLTGARVGAVDYLTLSAPTRVDRDGTVGVIAIPLSAQRRAIERKTGEVGDAILIITCLTSLLLAAVGWAMARRVAEPVSLLARAARRVAAGDLDVRVETRAADETALLVDAFNRMAASVRDQREDLERRRDYIEAILKTVTTGVVSIDAAGSITTINPAAQALLRGPGGVPVAGDRLPDRLASVPALEPLRRALDRALERPVEREAEVVLVGDGGERRLRVVSIPFAGEKEAPRGRIFILEDVTEVVRSGRLAAWTEMARRVAHEIKNPLTPIQLSVEHVRRLHRAGDPAFASVLRDCLDNIQKQVGVLRQIAHEFSAYARLPRLRPVATPVGVLLEEALGPYETAAPPGIRLQRVLPGDLPPVQVDRAVVVRALVNLIENALQAMPSGGSLTVSAAAADGARPPGTVRIEVRDTGEGIDPEALPRLFEPYFSTRVGGTGLGLAVARRAVEEQGGTLEIRSRRGEGTVAILTLPVAGAAPEEGK
jgi:PAS domain S-box-containing protein